jgi:glycosyltransferase involved in cell wall biosynthesis
MVHVIHLTPAEPDFQTQRCLDYLMNDLGDGFSSTQLSLGSGGDFHHSFSAALQLRRIEFPQDPIVHAWGNSAFGAAALAGACRIIFSPLADAPGRPDGWMRMILRYPPIQVVFPTEAMRREFLWQGWQANRCQVIPPVLNLDRFPAPHDGSLRQRLGFNDGDFVALVPGESARNAADRIAAWAISILHVIDPRFRLLAWGRGPTADGLVRFGRRLHQENLVTLAERRLGGPIEFEALTAAADAVLVPAEGFTPSLPLCACMAAGLPIVANAGPDVAELLDDDVNALIVPKATPKTLAQAVWRIKEDPALARRLGDSARDKARKINSLQRFLEQWRDLYHRPAIPANVR